MTGNEYVKPLCYPGDDCLTEKQWKELFKLIGGASTGTPITIIIQAGAKQIPALNKFIGGNDD